jgi:cytosolic carboxypeptidase protein 2/3
MASHMLKGALDFIVEDSKEASKLRNAAVVKCIPMLNPDGVVCGNSRCNLAGLDLNRQWSEPSTLTGASCTVQCILGDQALCVM